MLLLGEKWGRVELKREKMLIMPMVGASHGVSSPLSCVMHGILWIRITQGIETEH